MDRGDVYVVNIAMPETVVRPFPNWMPKWVVVLQGADLFPNASQITVVVASSLKPHKPIKPGPWYVLVGQAEGFDKPSAIDGRTVMTLPASRFDSALYKTTLSVDFMDKKVARAIVRGLDLMRPPDEPRR